MIACIFLNGEFSSDNSSLKILNESEVVIAADGGYYHAEKAGIKVDLLIGDFDSWQGDDLPNHTKHIHDPSQESTDLEKALSTLPGETSILHIFGGLGGRHDHFLTTLLILASLPDKIEVQLHGKLERWYRVSPDKTFELPSQIGQTISLLPLAHCTVKRTSGLKWNLQNKEMGIGEQLGVSNQAIGELVSIETSEGYLYLAQLHTS